METAPSPLDNELDEELGLTRVISHNISEMSKIDVPTDVINKFSPLFINLGADYFLTVTYHPKCRLLFNCFNPAQQLHETRRELLTLLKGACLFILKPELTLQGKIHYHAVVRITDKIKWYKSVLPKLNSYGRMRVETIRNGENCMKYILKEYNEYCEIFNKSNILYHNCSNFKITEMPVNDEICLKKFLLKLNDWKSNPTRPPNAPTASQRK